MFKMIIDWFIVNYEMYLLIGLLFAFINIYGTLRDLHRVNKYRNIYKINAWGYISPILTIVFYPIFIIIWLLNKFAQWQ